MRTPLLPAVAVVAAVLLVGGCSSAHSPQDTVPTLSGGTAAGPTPGPTSGSAVGWSSGRPAALHAAAECIRTHGVPTYQDPVLTADGHVYTDSRSALDFAASSGAASKDDPMAALRQACGQLMIAAGLSPADEPPAPPQLVQAGVVAARCLRANGLPNYRDPTSATPFTPGHGFGISGDEMPNNGSGGKQDPTFQRALQACRTQLDTEIRASELSSLAHD